MALNEILIFTNGILYEKINKLKKYPIPEIPFERNTQDNITNWILVVVGKMDY